MKIQCGNPECAAQFDVSEKYAGRRVKCPKCSSPIAIPAAGMPSPPPGMTSSPSGAGAGPSIATPQSSGKPSIPPVLNSEEASPQIQVGGSGPVGVSPTSRTSQPQSQQAPAPKSKMGLMIGGGVAAVVVIAVACFFIFSSSGNTPNPSTGDGPVADASGETGAPTTPVSEPQGAPKGMFEIEWKEIDRPGGVVFIDGAKKMIPSSGPVTFELDAGIHKIQLMRRGYEPLEKTLMLEGDETKVYTPMWRETGMIVGTPESPPDLNTPFAPIDQGSVPDEGPAIDEGPTFADWIQDFEAAKQLAARNRKDILVAFCQSDSSQGCELMASEVFLRPEFREKFDHDYELVYVDMPRFAEARSKVENYSRNSELRIYYGVTSYPTVLLTDSKGRPLGAIRGYITGGVDGFADEVDNFKVLGSQLKMLFNQIDVAQTNEMKSVVIAQAMELLSKESLIPYYRHELNEWRDIVTSAQRTPTVVEPHPGTGVVGTEPDPTETTDSPDSTATAVGMDIPTSYTDPETFLTELGLKKIDGSFVLPQEWEVSKLVREAETLKRKIVLEQKKVAQAQNIVDQKEQMVQTLLQQELVLRGQLPNAVTVDNHNKIVSAINQIVTKVEMLDRSSKEEDALKEARTSMNAAMEDYTEHLLNARKLYDEANSKYEVMLANATVGKAIEEFNGSSEKPHKLGPSTGFSISDRKLSSLEATVMTDTIPLRRGGGNLWYVPVVVNQTKPVELIVDTGASCISLPWSVALGMGLEPGSDARTVMVSLADGSVVEGKKVLAKKVRVGKFTAENVECIVLPASMRNADPLLGQSFFQNFNCKVDTAGGRMILSKLE